APRQPPPPSAIGEPTTEAWPPGLADRVEAALGKRFVRPGRVSHRLIDKQIAHALRVWADKYGVDGRLSDEQLELAAQLLEGPVTFVASTPPRAKGQRNGGPLAVLKSAGSPLLSVVNSDEAHEAFQRLAAADDTPLPLADVIAELAALQSASLDDR